MPTRVVETCCTVVTWKSWDATVRSAVKQRSTFVISNQRPTGILLFMSGLNHQPWKSLIAMTVGKSNDEKAFVKGKGRNKCDG